jgi:hypothetical protein
MSSIDRPDVIENKRLEKIFDLDSVSFEDLRWLFHDFIKDVLINEKVLEELGVSTSILDKIIYYNHLIERHLKGLISAETINNEGYNSWELHDQSTGCDKHALRFVMTGLCDEKKASLTEYGASMLIGLLVSLSYRIGRKKLSNAFGIYIEHYPRMQKYKLP